MASENAKNDKQQNLLSVALYLIRSLDLPVTYPFLKERLTNHFEFPAMSSLSDVLYELNIANLPVDLSVEELDEIVYPAVAYLDDGGGYFAVVLKKEAHNIHYYDPAEGEKTLSLQEFQEKWQGVTLLIEPNSSSGDLNYAENKKELLKVRFSKWLLIFLAFSLLAMLLQTVTSLFSLTLIFLNLIGLVFSGLLLFKEVGFNFKITEQICEFGKNTSCNKVIQSRVASLKGWARNSEIGTFYFLTGIVFLLFLGLQGGEGILAALGTLGVISICALPFTAFFVFYQAVILRTWCVLCLTVQSVIWIEIVLLSPYLRYVTIDRIILPLTIFLGLFVLLSSIWFLIKPLLFLKRREHLLKRKLSVYTKDATSFKNSLQPLPLAQSAYHIPRLITIGSTDAAKHLTVVLSFQCQSCFHTLQELRNLGALYEDLCISIQLLFQEEKNKRIASHLYQLRQTRGNEIALEALEYWYQWQNYDYWKMLYPINENRIDLEAIDDLLQYSDYWTSAIDLTYTPTFILSNHLVDSKYSIYDIKYHVRNFGESELAAVMA